MKKWLKRHFIPHEGNAFRPHFLHRKNAVQLVGVVLFFELILFILPAIFFSGFIQSLNLSSVLPGVLTTLTNSERLGANLPELTESEVLNLAATLKAEDMASKGYFAHTSPEGLSPWHWLDQVGYEYTYAGENLAVNFIDSADVTRAWMNSPTHKANIVGGAYTEVGTGIATGVYKGNETVFVAQMYGRPMAKSQIPISKPQTFSNAQIANANILGESQVKTTGIKQVTQEIVDDFLKQAAASPRRTTDAVLYSILGIITLAVIFNIFVRVRHQHPDLILNGAVVMVVIFGLHIANSYVSLSRASENSFIAFDSQNHIVAE